MSFGNQSINLSLGLSSERRALFLGTGHQSNWWDPETQGGQQSHPQLLGADRHLWVRRCGSEEAQSWTPSLYDLCDVSSEVGTKSQGTQAAFKKQFFN